MSDEENDEIKQPDPPAAPAVEKESSVELAPRTKMPANVTPSPAAEQPVVLPTPQETQTPLAAPEKPAVAKEAEQAGVYVAPNLHELVNEPERPALRKEVRDLDSVVHAVLIVGLIISTIFMLIGLVLDLVLNRQVPAAVPDVTQIPTLVFALRPSGFLALGLVVLIATPIVRVVGSIFAFVYERDWRFTLITSVVLAVVLFSMFLGRG